MDLAVIAHHEAGHAVAHILVGHRFRYVTIRPRRQRATGRVAVHPRMVDAFPRAVTAYAGPEAEAHYLRGLGLDEHDVTAAIAFGACDDDFETAAAALPDKEQQAPANRTAKVLVGQCWPAIERVADRLLAQPRALAYREVRTLVGAAAR